MQHAADARGLPALAVGFSPPEALAPLAEHLGWHGRFLSDPHRALYRRLHLGRAPWWRSYTPGTLAIYARALARSPRATSTSNPRGVAAPVEDTRQLGEDAVVRDGVAHILWRPRSPNDRVDPDTLAETAHHLSVDPPSTGSTERRRR